MATQFILLEIEKLIKVVFQVMRFHGSQPQLPRLTVQSGTKVQPVSNFVLKTFPYICSVVNLLRFWLCLVSIT